MRKLATIEKIENISPIEGADFIERASIRGWQIVIKKGDHKVGELIIYMEIDSLLPERPEFEFLRPRGFRIKTIKLKNQISQGIIFPLSILEEAGEIMTKEELLAQFPDAIQEGYNPSWEKVFVPDKNSDIIPIIEGEDVTEILGIKVYEAPIPAELAGKVKGPFPSHSIRTDEERCIHENTLIKTDTGDIKISDLVKNPKDFKIFSFNHEKLKPELNKILSVSVKRNNKDWYKITLEDKSEIILTSNHPVFLPEIEAYRMVKDLKFGDEVLIVEE